MACTMLGLYFVLPMGYAEAYYVDVRALPLACLLLVAAILTFAREHPSRDTVDCEYRFLLITKPFNAARIPVSTITVKENGSAALLSLAPHCAG